MLLSSSIGRSKSILNYVYFGKLLFSNSKFSFNTSFIIRKTTLLPNKVYKSTLTSINKRTLNKLVYRTIRLNLSAVSHNGLRVHPFFSSYFLTLGNSNLHTIDIKNFSSIYKSIFSLISNLFLYNINIFFFTTPLMHYEYNSLN